MKKRGNIKEKERKRELSRNMRGGKYNLQRGRRRNLIF
jgi:hypothetical protein